MSAPYYWTTTTAEIAFSLDDTVLPACS